MRRVAIPERQLVGQPERFGRRQRVGRAISKPERRGLAKPKQLGPPRGQVN
jgi:hypothetical protein